MKKYLFLLVTLVIISCNSTPKQQVTIDTKAKIDYPADLVSIFNNHGGLDKWRAMNSISYEIVKEGKNEKQFIDLQNRRERIESSNFTSGFDGKQYWIEADTSYKGNPKFYTNLIFYFYSMPFVLADEGINYEKSAPLEFEGETYPGYRISYGDGIGLSPDDEYFIHYDPVTNEMAWLGYTVTFHSGEKSKKVKYIRYNDWKSFNGLKLPNSMTWFNIEDGNLVSPKSTRKFENVTISDSKFPDSKFEPTQGARILE